MIKNKKILSVVLARAGSKGIPLKNVKLLLDKPLFQWSILASLNCKYVDLTVVSSNCPYVRRSYFNLLKEISKSENANMVSSKLYWIDRPDKYATDISKNEETLIHAYRKVVRSLNFDPDIIVTLQPTSPCRLNRLLEKCIEKYYEGEYDSLLTATKDTPFIWRKINREWKYTVDKNHPCNRKMRQEFEDNKYNSEFLWHDCGNIFLTDIRVLLGTECRIGEKPYIYTIDGLNGLQIDTEFDFNLIENMIKSYNLESLV